MSNKYLISFDNAKINYHKHILDSEITLIFLHGLGGDLTAWKEERKFFSNLGISNLAIDLRGHGLSERRNYKEFYSFENTAQDVMLLIQKEGIKNPILIGHCYGGMASIYFSYKYPKLPRSIILIDTSYRIPFFSNHEVAAELFTTIINKIVKYLPENHINKHVNFNIFKHTTDYNAKRLLSDILHTSIKSYLLMCEELIGYDATRILNDIIAPVLVIEGTQDSVFPPEIAAKLKTRIKNSEIDLIPNSNHILVVTNPSDVNHSIKHFLLRQNLLID